MTGGCELQGEPRITEVCLSMADRTSATTLNAVVDLADVNPEIWLEGNAFFAGWWRH